MRTIRQPHWIVHSHLFDPDEYECSECGYAVRRAGKICPVCGAVIRGEKDDQRWIDEAEELDWLLEDGD